MKCIFYIFENVKKFKQKCFVYNSMFYVSTKSFQEKTTFYVIYLKMTKFSTKINLSGVIFFVFFVEATKYIFFSQNFACARRIWRIHTYILPNFLTF
jgi:hypothetical protein